jgi:hypothetical protein
VVEATALIQRSLGIAPAGGVLAPTSTTVARSLAPAAAQPEGGGAATLLGRFGVQETQGDHARSRLARSGSPDGGRYSRPAAHDDPIGSKPGAPRRFWHLYHSDRFPASSSARDPAIGSMALTSTESSSNDRLRRGIPCNSRRPTMAPSPC